MSVQARTIRLTTRDWPPYSTASDGHGASDAVVRAAFAAMGDDIEIRYMPWQRAILGVKQDPTVDGVFPAYASKDRNDFCHWSQPIGKSPVGLAERRDAPLSWRTLDDLKNIRLGVVQGFVNTAEFDAKLGSGELSAEKAPDDAANLRKLLAHRLQAAVIDRNVMRYLMSSDPSLRGNGDQLQFNAHFLESKPLFVCFRKDAAGLTLARTFDEGLRRIDAESVASRALESMGW
jgi:polar amino acid transport system substrate-binding protein